MKHPGPWKQGALGFIRDANGKAVCSMKTLDHETRAILTHAAEMFATLKAIWESDTFGLDGAVNNAGELLKKMEAEIAAAKGTP